MGFCNGIGSRVCVLVVVTCNDRLFLFKKSSICLPVSISFAVGSMASTACPFAPLNL